MSRDIASFFAPAPTSSVPEANRTADAPLQDLARIAAELAAGGDSDDEGIEDEFKETNDVTGEDNWSEIIVEAEGRSRIVPPPRSVPVVEVESDEVYYSIN